MPDTFFVVFLQPLIFDNKWMFCYYRVLVKQLIKYMHISEWPHCNLDQCHLHYKCQSQQSLIMRILRDDPESKDLFKSCQKITHFAILNGYETPHSKGTKND